MHAKHTHTYTHATPQPKPNPPTQAKATKESYRFKDLVRYLRDHLRTGGMFLKLRFVEFAGMLALVYFVARSVAISSTSPEPGSRLLSRLMFPGLGVVTFRYGQFGSCLALIVAAAAIFVVTYGKLDRTESSGMVSGWAGVGVD